MTDKELLELAAKAVGYDSAIDMYEYNEIGEPLIDANDPPTVWNPLTDDGDRYRLAKSVKGNLYFSGKKGCFEILSDSDEPPILGYFEIGNEREEAYAIVRAAAEIGRNMK